MSRARLFALRPCLAGLALAAVAGAAQAWTPTSQTAIADEAASLAPPDLARQILRHLDRYHRGVVEAYRDRDPLRHMKNPDGTGTLDRVIVEEAEKAVAMIREHRPFPDIAYQMGRVSHYLADANNPLNASQADPSEGDYFADFLFYLESAQSRFAPVFYGIDSPVPSSSGLTRLVAQTLRRARSLYPLIGAEYRRTGAIDGRALFDDRSTAFAIGALSYSHALSDVASAFRDIWLRAGGGDARNLAALQGERLLVLPQPGASQPASRAPAG